MDELAKLVTLLRTTPPSILLTAAIALLLWRGAFNTWPESVTRFRNRRIAAAADLLKTSEGKVSSHVLQALKDEYEAAIFARFLGRKVDSLDRIALKNSFSLRGLPMDFFLLRGAWPYLEPRERFFEVKPLGGWRRAGYIARVAIYGFLTLCVAAFFSGALVLGEHDPAARAALGTTAVAAALLAAMLLPGLWNYQAARRLTKLFTQNPLVHNDSDENAANDASARQDIAQTGAVRELGGGGSPGSPAGRQDLLPEIRRAAP